MLNLSNNHRHEKIFISSTSSSMVLDTSLKIRSFLTFQITQYTTCQIILKPFYIFLWIDPPLQHSPMDKQIRQDKENNF